MPDPELNPRESDTELLEELVAELLVRMENGGIDVLDTFCLEHPTHEAAVRQRISGATATSAVGTATRNNQ